MNSTNRIRVHAATLEAFASRVSAVRNDLEGDSASFGDNTGGLESPTIEQALQAFGSAWSQKRGHLVHELGGAESALANAASAFSQTDAKLASSVSNDHAGGGGAP